MNKPESKQLQKDRPNLSRRRLAGMASLGVLPLAWNQPVVNIVLLPAHATTTTEITACEPNYVAGGSLVGNPYGASNCTEACEALAGDVGGELCAVEETTTSRGVQCSCQISLP